MPLTCVPETDVVLSQSATKVTHREKQKSKVCYFVFTFILTVDSCFLFQSVHHLSPSPPDLEREVDV